MSGVDGVASSELLAVEATAALGAANRSGRLSGRGLDAALSDLAELLADVAMVPVTSGLVEHAKAVTLRRGLRAYDAVHIASALSFTTSPVFATFDRALAEAARAEGLEVFPA